MRRNDPARPRAHHVDDIGQIRRLAQVVGHENAGEPPLHPKVLQHGPQFLAGEGIERAERLVEHEEFGRVDQRAAEIGALLHTARQHPRLALFETGQAHTFEQPTRDRLVFLALAA